MMKRLKNKVAVVYGDGGVGRVMQKAFAREGASVQTVCLLTTVYVRHH